MAEVGDGKGPTGASAALPPAGAPIQCIHATACSGRILTESSYKGQTKEHAEPTLPFGHLFPEKGKGSPGVPCAQVLEQTPLKRK